MSAFVISPIYGQKAVAKPVTVQSFGPRGKSEESCACQPDRYRNFKSTGSYYK